MKQQSDKEPMMSGIQTIWSDSWMSIRYLSEGSFFSEVDVGEHDKTDKICMLFCLNGRMQVKPLFKDRFCEQSVAEGFCSLHSNPGGCRVEYVTKNASQGVIIIVSRSRFLHLIAGQGICREFQPLLNEALPVHRIITVTPAMKSIIHQMIQPVHTGEGIHLFYMAKILELVFALTPRDNLVWNVSRMDRCIVQKAMAYLEACMDTPPSITELAGQVGVSVSKFKQLFPRVCGMTPYAYLRKLRMEKAISLLKKGGMNVTEVAYEVGYNSISHFAKVFYQYNGIKPSQVRSKTLFS